MKRILVVGAGLTGAVIAERIASQLGHHVTLIDRRSHIGGNAYDVVDSAGVMIHPYGPHIFHTNSPRVVDYLSSFTRWRPYEHRVLAFVDDRLMPVPFNFTSMNLYFGNTEGARLNKILADEFGTDVNVPILKMRKSPNPQIRKISDLVYENIFLNYTRKQWGLDPDQLDPSVSARVPVRLSFDDRYFQDSFQQMPADGYAIMTEKIVSHPSIKIITNTCFSEVSDEPFEHTVYTGPIDEFFDSCHGALPYRSLKFEWVTDSSTDCLQPTAVTNYPTPASKHPYTRSTEYRHLTAQHGIGFTSRSLEFAETYAPGLNEPYYPIPIAENRELFAMYRAEADKLTSVTFAGRLADYQYYNMDQAVARALSCFEKEILPAISS